MPLRLDMRLDHPFVKLPFDGRRYEITHGAHRLVLDVDSGERTASSPP